MASPFNIIANTAPLPVPSPNAHPRPDWLRVKFLGGERYQELKRTMRTLDLHTVCESARCPNMGECWEHGTATFMILGDICTRACGFCAVPSGKPVGPPDEDEPDALNTVLAVRPDVLNHNTETVPRLYRQVRKGARYERSLELLHRAKQTHPDVPTKTGLMLGLGEERHEVLSTMQDLAAQGTDILTLGQYLQPTREHLPIVRYVHPDEFSEYKFLGEQMGFKHVEAGPLVRSSYHAFDQAESAVR